MHATLSRSLRQYLDHGRSNSSYIITPGEPHIGDYLVRRPRGNAHRHHCLHYAQTAAADYTVRQAAAARTIDKRRAYDRDFETTNPNVNLVIFAVEDSGAVHPEAHQFLRSHARLVAPDNSGRELGHSLASLSVSIQAARAKSVTTARDLLSVDALPPQPYITGILPIVPPPAWLAPDVHPRRFAVMPFPERPPPIPEPMAYQIPWIPPIPSQHTP